MSNLSMRIVEERASLKWDALTCAQQLNISDAELRRIETGKERPSAAVLQRLAERGADVHYILTGARLLRRANSLSKEQRNLLFANVASIEIKFAAIPISRYEPSLGSLEVVAPQQLIDGATTLHDVAARAAQKFEAQLLHHLRSLKTFDAQATELQQVHLRG